ncbi:siderophore-interacting protein [Cellulosimicrobium protaetiae]|uniref:Siderophore-interacting protein n=1 Tax=Cellulosimicrobium protaetiae TaxID=2587808 RepID=A0A6M5UA21_9MICO|nr:siderophore-interacting protein [Cellulosimicrobium protaetiae]QJW35357.1 siderophore-interacting protein [Cellulosimicrobium protaetiae]
MFDRPVTRLDLVPRRVRVHAVQKTSGALRRITFRDAVPLVPDGDRPVGPDTDGPGETSLATLRAPGPDDHVKVFLPDPATGLLHAPTLTADGALQRPTGVVSISRELTVRATRTVDGVAEVDVDWVLHGGADPGAPPTGDGGPASAWAARATEGDEVVLAGPTTSRAVPDGVARLLLVGDEAGLPALACWVDAVGPDVPVTAIVEVGDDVDEAFVEDELGRATVEILYRTDGPGQLAEAVRALGPLDAGELVFGAGEATDLAQVRRDLRRGGARPDQLALHGYWRRGVVNLDPDAPLDPTDPD